MMKEETWFKIIKNGDELTVSGCFRILELQKMLADALSKLLSHKAYEFIKEMKDKDNAKAIRQKLKDTFCGGRVCDDIDATQADNVADAVLAREYIDNFMSKIYSRVMAESNAIIGAMALGLQNPTGTNPQHELIRGGGMRISNIFFSGFGFRKKTEMTMKLSYGIRRLSRNT